MVRQEFLRPVSIQYLIWHTSTDAEKRLNLPESAIDDLITLSSSSDIKILLHWLLDPWLSQGIITKGSGSIHTHRKYDGRGNSSTWNMSLFWCVVDIPISCSIGRSYLPMLSDVHTFLILCFCVCLFFFYLRQGYSV